MFEATGNLPVSYDVTGKLPVSYPSKVTGGNLPVILPVSYWRLPQQNVCNLTQFKPQMYSLLVYSSAGLKSIKITEQ